MFKWLGKLGNALFGSSDKGIVTEVSDAVDKWVPSETTRHRMSIEDMQAGDSSQASARGMQLRSHDSWFDILIDGLNRLPRPIITFWVIGVLFGIVPIPVHWEMIPPMVWNVIWTVVTFWFGARMIFKDIPAIYGYVRKMKDN